MPERLLEQREEEIIVSISSIFRFANEFGSVLGFVKVCRASWALESSEGDTKL